MQPDLATRSDLRIGGSFAHYKSRIGEGYGRWSVSTDTKRPFFADVALSRIGDFAISQNNIENVCGERNKNHIKSDKIDFLLIRHILNGNMTVEHANRYSFLQSGSTIIMDMARPINLSIHDPAEHFDLIVPRATGMALIPHLLDLCGTNLHRDAPLGRILGSYLEQLNHNLMASPPEARSLLILAGLRLVAACNGYDADALSVNHRLPMLSTIQRYILANINDPDLSVSMICRDLDLNSRYVHRAFEKLDFSVTEWIRRQRLHSSRAELGSFSSQSQTISQIAMKYGFYDASHFARSFRQLFGVSPTEYRRQVANS